MYLKRLFENKSEWWTR